MKKDSIKFLSLLIPVFHLLIVIILWQNMPNDGLIGKKMLFMILPSIIISLIVTYLFYEILIIINKLAQQICFYLLILLISIVTIFMLFPCSQNFCATDAIEEIFYLRELQKNVEIKDIFRYEKEPFVQKLIIKKFGLKSYLYNVTISDTNRVTLNNYKLIFLKDKLYSDNGNLSFKMNDNIAIVEDFYPNEKDKKIIYNLVVKQNPAVYQPIYEDNIIELYSNHLSIKVYIKREAIIFNDFGFLNIAANWALL